MYINLDYIQRTESFLKETFQNSPVLSSDSSACSYRLEHSYRVANIGKEIALKEGFHPTEMIVACLLHDISYSQRLDSREAQLNHGRLSAQIVRPFLESLNFTHERIQDICYGIAIHVDGKANFEGKATAFAETISDADNIDRFDVYRIYETLHYKEFQNLPLEKKQEEVDATLHRLRELRDRSLATKTATVLWKERIEFYIAFYERLDAQLSRSTHIL